MAQMVIESSFSNPVALSVTDKALEHIEQVLEMFTESNATGQSAVGCVGWYYRSNWFNAAAVVAPYTVLRYTLYWLGTYRTRTTG